MQYFLPNFGGPGNYINKQIKYYSKRKYCELKLKKNEQKVWNCFGLRQISQKIFYKSESNRLLSIRKNPNPKSQAIIRTYLNSKILPSNRTNPIGSEKSDPMHSSTLNPIPFLVLKYSRGLEQRSFWLAKELSAKFRFRLYLLKPKSDMHHKKWILLQSRSFFGSKTCENRFFWIIFKI